MHYFKSKEGILALFVSISCLTYFLVVPSEDTEIKRARAKSQTAPVTLQNVKGVFKENHVAASNAAETTNAFCINVPILMYHHIEPLNMAKEEGHDALTTSPQMFESHILELRKKGYKIISLEEAVNALVTKTDPGKAVAITIDDGYKDNFIFALPIAEKHSVPVTFFISPGLIENPGYMTWPELITAAKSPFVSIYDHTWSHFSLPSGDMAEAREEVVSGRRALEEKLGEGEKIFAYPYGSFDSRSVEIMIAEGYTAAFTTQVSSTLCDSQMLTLPRVRIGEAPLSFFGL